MAAATVTVKKGDEHIHLKIWYHVRSIGNTRFCCHLVPLKTIKRQGAITMKTLKFSHVGVSVKDLDEAVKFYTDVLGIDKKNITFGGRADFMRIANIMIGNERLELLQFVDKENTVIAGVGSDNNHALQHIGIYVDDVAAAMEEFRALGAEMLDKKPRHMPDGHIIGFVIPKKTEMLIELMQK
jgi:methylmalonyl-CoA/ethylmalonyl-CoA epimerase